MRAEDLQLKTDILQLKKDLGPEVMILGHHYQRHGIVDVADIIGDSFGLAKAAAAASSVKSIVFCGVRFMAESAAILCRDDQNVFHPEPEAGCPMADMAPMDSVQSAWQSIISRADFVDRKMIPVTYMNSHAPLKAFTGTQGGLVCTSSNAQKALEWAWARGDTVLFFPDQHLGRNTAKLMGLKESEMRVWYPSKTHGGIDSLQGVKLILWNGNCPVHMKFSVRDVLFVKEQFPDAKVVVHPECDQRVVDLADAVGSTEFICKYVSALPEKTQVFIGTEINLVERLRRENRHLKVEALFRSLCPTMYMVNLQKLKSTLIGLKNGTLEASVLKDSVLKDVEKMSEGGRSKTIWVPMTQNIKEPAKWALERMLALSH